MRTRYPSPRPGDAACELRTPPLPPPGELVAPRQPRVCPVTLLASSVAYLLCKVYIHSTMSILADEYSYERQIEKRRAAEKAAEFEQEQNARMLDEALQYFRRTLDEYPLAKELMFGIFDITLEPAVHCAFAKSVMDMGHPLEVRDMRSKQWVPLNDPNELHKMDPSSGAFRVVFKGL